MSESLTECYFPPRRRTAWPMLAAIALCWPGLASAGQLAGRVTDSSGAFVPGARVQIIRPEIAATEAVADAEGRFTFPSEAMGTYELRIVAPGFAARTVRWTATSPAASLAVELQPAVVSHSVTVVSGSRRAELQEDSPQRVEAVTREQIRATTYERVSDVLSEVPGVVTRRGSTATGAGEQVQGIDSRQVLVLQDGLPIVGGRGIKSGVVNLNRQEVGRLERVEVAKGAGSALYGTDAIGGVVNLITREPSQPVESELSLSGGSLGALDGRGSIGTRWRSLSLLVAGGSHRMDAYRLIPDSPSTVGPDWRRHDGMGKLRWWATPRLALGLSATAYHNREEGVNLSEQGLAGGVANDSMQSYAATVDFTVTPNTTWQARAYAARYDENARTTLVARPNDPASLANLNQRYHRLDTTVSQQWRGHLTQGGVEWVQDNYRGANRLVGDNAGQQITLTDGWLQDRWTLHPRATLTLGGRVTSHSLFGTYAVPKAGLVVRASEKLILRASYGHGFRAPDLGQLYFRFANPANFYQVIGNPNLTPENSRSLQAGATWRAGRWRLSATLFRNDVRDLIDTRLLGTPRTTAELLGLLAPYGVPDTFTPLLNRQTFLYLNLGRVFTRGIEFDGEVSLTRQWRIRGAYTLLDARDKLSRLRLAQRHRHQGFFATDYAIPRWGITTNLRGTFFSHWLLNAAANTRAYPYALWDVSASKALPRGLTVFAAMDNLADSRDRRLGQPQPTFDRPDYGRTFRVGMRHIFPRAE